jgi:hypothetical protein
MAQRVVAHKKLTIDDVTALGRTLIRVSDLYPTKFLSERDFFPLVVAYLTGRVPALTAEVAAKGGRVDFQLKGTNPTWLELVVQPRILADKNCPALVFPGHNAKTSLYAGQNPTELKKLMAEPKGKTRFLLLVDLHGGYDIAKLKAGYSVEAKKIKKGKPVRVVYVSRSGSAHFLARA